MITDTDAREISDDATRIAVLSPLLAGCAWGVLSFVNWKVAMGRPDANLGTAIAFWGYLLLGILGLGLLLIPLLIGLTTRSTVTRLAAAWVGAGLTALAGAFCLTMAIAADLDASRGVLVYVSAVVLFAPLVVTSTVSRR